MGEMPLANNASLVGGRPMASSNDSLDGLDLSSCLDICTANACASLPLAEQCVRDFIFPTATEWLFIGLHLVLFTVGVLGNFLVCLVVLRSKHMQTVTNLFIVNLALADGVVLVLCSPPTVLQAVTETWFLGEAMCKLVVYFQNTAVSVSVLTLCAIAVERYFAICRPLKSRITTRKVTVTIATIWLISATIGTPNIANVVGHTFAHPRLRGYLLTCRAGLDPALQTAYIWFLILALYLTPMAVIGLFYLVISHHLWNVRIPGSMVRETTDGYRTHAELQLASRKKVAKMLIAIVLLFAACYFPVNLIFALRQLGVLHFLNDSSVLPIIFMLAHWLCYFNSALNPLIYNFMSVKFKKEFRHVFSCRGRDSGQLQHDSTWLPSSRLVRNTHTATRMLRTMESSTTPLRDHKLRLTESTNMVNGDSV